MKKEIEIKIKVPKELFYSIAGSSEDFHLERTFGYFREDFSNMVEGVFPRIKYLDTVDGEIIFGVKKKLSEDQNYFERQEIDIHIENVTILDDLRELMKLLGFKKEIIFEKKRKNLYKDEITISFDELPFGYFIELEAKPEIIEHYVKEYALVEQPRIVKSYLGLWEEYKKQNNISDLDCVFK